MFFLYKSEKIKSKLLDELCQSTQHITYLGTDEVYNNTNIVTQSQREKGRKQIASP